jgi:hypothetical protein
MAKNSFPKNGQSERRGAVGNENVTEKNFWILVQKK